MPNRIIRDGILTSERVASLSWEAEVFYRRLLSLVDDYGLADARPSVLRSALYPLQLDKMSECNIQRCLAACEKAGLILLFTRNGKSFLMVRNFGQSLRSAPKCPLPDGYKAIQTGKSRYQLVTPEDDCLKLQADENNCEQLFTNANAYSNAKEQVKNAEGNITVDCSVSEGGDAPALSRGRLGATGAARFLAATLAINPSWGRTLPTALEQAAAMEAYRSAQGRVTPRDMEMLRDYYASGMTHDRNNKAFWRPDSRKKFWECFGDVLTHADRWAKETRWKPAFARKKLKTEQAPQQPDGPVVDVVEAAAEIASLRESMGIGGDE